MIPAAVAAALEAAFARRRFLDMHAHLITPLLFSVQMQSARDQILLAANWQRYTRTPNMVTP